MEQKKRGVKALIFDIGGVLQLGHHSFDHSRVHSLVAEKLKTPLDQYLDSIDTAYAKSIEGKISEKKALKIMARNLKTNPKKLTKLYIQAYKKYFELNKELIKYALEKKKQGYRIAILSDQWYLSKRALIPRDFYEKFDVVVVSCDVGIRKPNPRIYRLTLKKLKLPAKQTIFIDNQEWNIKPAKKLGMKTVLFKNNKQTIRELDRLLK